MTLSRVQIGENENRLMQAIGDAILRHTSKSPMTPQAIVGVIAFCAGAAIIRSTDKRGFRHQLREMAIANIDQGMDAMRRASTEAPSNLILPATFQ